MNKKYYTLKWENKIKQACINNKTMASACASIKMNKNTFIAHAKRLDCYTPNQAGKGITRNVIPKYKLLDILNGKHPQYPTCKLRLRLLKENIKAHQCDICNLTKWNNLPIPIELHHIDGDNTNHYLINLQILCPNCHAQTNNYCSKNKKH